MTVADVEAALRAHREAKQHTADTLASYHAAIVAALADGVTQADLVRVTGYTRERIRQIARAAGA